MKVKALENFSGAVSAYKGEELEIVDEAISRDLLAAGYVEATVEKKTVPKNTEKRSKNES